MNPRACASLQQLNSAIGGNGVCQRCDEARTGGYCCQLRLITIKADNAFQILLDLGHGAGFQKIELLGHHATSKVIVS